MKKTILFFAAVLVASTLIAQNVLSDESIKQMNSIHPKDHFPNKEVIKYPSLREADVMWSRTVWREIDLREKINHALYYPENDGMGYTIDDRKSLIDVVYQAILDGELTAYGNAAADDEFKLEMTDEEIKTIGGAKEEWVETTDFEALAEGVDAELAVKKVLNKEPFDRNTVKKWRVKEIWYFDKQRSVMGVRIIGLCPLQEGKDEVTGRLDGSWNPLFWVRFEEARAVLVNAEVFNLMKNDAERRTYDDIFWKRMFNSTIVKEANVMDRKVSEYMIGLDALLESDRIKAEIFNIEHDLWEY